MSQAGAANPAPDDLTAALSRVRDRNESRRLSQRSGRRLRSGRVPKLRRSLGRHAVPERGGHAGHCIEKAQRALRQHGIVGEVIVADNGSTDGSQDIAPSMGARVVQVAAQGLRQRADGRHRRGRGRFVIMGDADDSYDFLEVPKFVERLREGYDLVQGCRLPSGGGTVQPGAMPLLHRWWGNPMFSAMVARAWFRAPVHDVYCGLRGVHEGVVRPPRPALHRDGVRDRDDHQGEPAGGAHRRGADHAAPDGRKAHAPHSGHSATAGGRCGSSCCTARAGCS